MSRELLVVMPVFNEEDCLESVLQEWSTELDASGIDYCLVVLNDGSTDRTAHLLREWQRKSPDGRFEFISRNNRGHGQTCLEGYRIACERKIPWVFQIDSDGQCDPAYFAAVWAARLGHDVVYAHRTKRHDGPKRVLASVLVKALVRAAAGVRCIDANVPYRLMSTTMLLPLVDSVPTEFDLANIALAVQIKRAGWREAGVPIVFRPRAGGEPSVPLARFAGKAGQLLVQLLRLPPPVRLETK